MNEDIAALLRVDHAKLTNFRAVMSGNMEQSTVPDLATHFGVKRRLIENDVYLLRFLAGQNCFDNRFGLKKIVPEKFRRRGSKFPFFDADFFFFLCLSRPLALLVHKFLKTGNIDSEAALTCHQLSEIKGKAVGVVKKKCCSSRH